MVRDALARDESAGCHFREEHQTPDGEARRNDRDFAHVAAWFHAGPSAPPRRVVEPLVYRHVVPEERNYR
jgi:succinate dehydrogenase / fumarate reductase flavoprotein subunit